MSPRWGLKLQASGEPTKIPLLTELPGVVHRETILKFHSCVAYF